MTFIRDLIGNNLEFICILLIAKFYLFLPLRPKKIELFFCLFISILSAFVTSYYLVSPWFIGQFFFLFYCLSLAKTETLVNRILYFCLCYTTIISFEFSIALIFNLLSFNNESLLTYIWGSIASFMSIFLLFKLTKLAKLYSLIKSAKLPFRILFIDTYLSLILILLFATIRVKIFYVNYIYIIIFFFFVLIANACLLYYDQKLYAEHKTVLSYQQNLPIYESLIQQIRANQHEYTNRIQTLQSLPNVCKDYDSICKALKESTENYQNSTQTYPLLQINMPVLASALFNQYTHAEKQNIKITFDIGSAELQSGAPEYQLADYACILTENAIEASKPGYHLYARLTSDNRSVHFEIRNPIEQLFQAEELSKFFHRGYTTKGEKKENGGDHGLGLYYLRHDIEKYHGTVGVDQLTFENETWIIFYIDV